MSVLESIAIYLIDGQYGPHSNIYELGFPPPTEIVAFENEDSVALCGIDQLEQAQEQDSYATVYTKVAQSQLPVEAHTAHLVRGARYKVKVEDESSGA